MVVRDFVVREVSPTDPVISTLSSANPNWVHNVTPDGVWVETTRSRALRRPPQLVSPAWMIQIAWEWLTAHGTLANQHLLDKDGLNVKRLSFVCAKLPKVSLEDALAILIVLAQRDPRFDRAAARWVGRLLTETPAGLSDARFALALVERLPECRDPLHGLARRG